MSPRNSSQTPDGRIRYSNCWEDPEVLLSALDMKPGGRVLSIASGGDNSFSLLTTRPSLVVAVDLSHAQLALVELKREGFRQLEHTELLQFLGFRDATAPQRLNAFQRLKDGLSDTAARYWEDHIDLIARGVIHPGKFEGYFRVFRTRVLPLVHSSSRVGALLSPMSRKERISFYNSKWDTWRWRLMFHLFFSRTIMGRFGRDPSKFEHVSGSVASRILKRTRHALTELPVEENPFIRYILTGSFQEVLPHYVRRENFELIQDNLPALQIHHGSLSSILGEKEDLSAFDAFNLSDIFEYMTSEQTRRAGETIAAAGNIGARVAYWNMLAPRSLADLLPESFAAQSERAMRLHRRDRGFFYQAFHLDHRIRGEA